MQSNEPLDALVFRADLERLQTLQSLQRLPFVDSDVDKPRRQSASTIDEFFEWPRAPAGARLAPPGSCPSNPLDEDVFMRPPLWEDITSSIQKLDPDNAEMLGLSGLSSMSAIKMEVTEEPALNSELHLVPHLVPQQQPQQPQPALPPPPHLQPQLHSLTGPSVLPGSVSRPHPMQSPHPLQRLPFPPPPTPRGLTSS